MCNILQYGIICRTIFLWRHLLQLLQIKDDLERLHTERAVIQKKIDQELHEDMIS